jgi:hypothetical protein
MRQTIDGSVWRTAGSTAGQPVAGGSVQNGIYFFEDFQSPLLAHKRNVASQCGEDGVIERIFELIPPTSRFCVEFGAWDGKHYSNCYNLLQNAGWSGLMIEASREKYPDLVATYAGNQRVKTLNRFVHFDGEDRLDNILAQERAPQSFGVLSIDVDGCDYHIWEALRTFSADLVVIEFNPTIPNDVRFVQEKSFDVNHGCSLLALIVLAKTKGYELAACTDWNAFFVRSDLYPFLGIDNNFINRMYRPQQNGRIFQGYDGTIFVLGMDKLFWSGIPVSSEDFQVLSKEQRVWNDAQRTPERGPKPER